MHSYVKYPMNASESHFKLQLTWSPFKFALKDIVQLSN